jgi:O-antigen ligase
LHLIWLPQSANNNDAINVILKNIHLLLIPLGFIVVDKEISTKEFHGILGMFLATCILFSLICVFSATYNVIRFGTFFHAENGVDHLYFTGYPLTAVVNIEPVYLSLFCTLAFLITLYTPLIGNLRLKSALAVYLIVFTALIGVKVGLISMAVITMIWLMTTGYKRLVYYSLGSIILAVVVVYYISPPVTLNDKFSSLFEFHYANENAEIPAEKAHHLKIWTIALEAFTENPIVGYGITNVQEVLNKKYTENNFDIGARDSLNAHNEFLSTALQFGITGIATLAAIIILPIVQALRAKDVLCLSFIIIVCMFFCVESLLTRQKGIIFFSYFYSLMLFHLAINGAGQSTNNGDAS